MIEHRTTDRGGVDQGDYREQTSWRRLLNRAAPRYITAQRAWFGATRSSEG
jgi:hypothetical protein